PSWRMPTSKLTRVRVDWRSKIIASTLSSSSRGRSPALRRVFSSTAWCSMPRRVTASKSSRLRKCRGLVITLLRSDRRGGGGRRFAFDGREQRGDLVHRLVDLGLGDDERGQQAQHVLARA